MADMSEFGSDDSTKLLPDSAPGVRDDMLGGVSWQGWRRSM